jgi:hypothetical protein
LKLRSEPRLERNGEGILHARLESRHCMAHRITFETRNRILLLSFQGIVTEESILIALSESISFVKANGTEGMIMDFSDIEDFRISAAFARNYADSREIVARGKPRIVVAPQPFVYGLFRMYQVHTEKSGVGPIPVRSMPEAFSLLKLASPVFGSEPWGAL